MRLILAALVLLGGCGSPCQQVKATRCNGQKVELCGSNKKWQRVMDCSQIKPAIPNAPKQWVCSQVGSVCTCVAGDK